MKRFFFVIVMICFAIHPGKAQKYWTLEECIRYALDNNIQIKRQELQSEISRNSYRQSRYQILPDLNAVGTHEWDFGRNVDAITNEITNTTVAYDAFYLTSSVTLFGGFQIRNTIEQNKYIVQKNLQDIEQTKNDISLQVATVFLQILFNEEALSIAESQLDVTALQLEKTKKLVDVGNKARGELLQIQAQEASERYNMVTAKNNVKVSYLTLAQLLELKNADDFRIQRPDSVTLDFKNVLATVDDIYKEGEVKLPQIKSAEYDQMASEKALSIARGKQYPTLTLSGTYGTGYSNANKKTVGIDTSEYTIGYVEGSHTPVLTQATSIVTGKYPFWSQLKDNRYKTVEFTLSVPIFNNFQARTNISNAELKLKDALYSMEQTKKSLYKEIQKAHTDAIAALEKYNSANEAVISNEESFKYTQQKFDVGMVSSVDYNVAKNSLTQAKSNLLQAKYEYLFKVKVLDFYRGIPLAIQ
jgi:outer membrane protein